MQHGPHFISFLVTIFHRGAFVYVWQIKSEESNATLTPDRADDQSEPLNELQQSVLILGCVFANLMS